ncbi:hypothetical protein [Streptomyces sp. MNP-20]|uniref:hypothetical protein n=1 Tax=Streptomyces sp. MNP-20 TaxID=2721165 RepID=UPI0015547250|nr:hypothetical protein [Streptomyces sp. MNP-20]
MSDYTPFSPSSILSESASSLPARGSGPLSAFGPEVPFPSGLVPGEDTVDLGDGGDGDIRIYLAGGSVGVPTGLCLSGSELSWTAPTDEDSAEIAYCITVTVDTSDGPEVHQRTIKPGVCSFTVPEEWRDQDLVLAVQAVQGDGMSVLSDSVASSPCTPLKISSSPAFGGSSPSLAVLDMTAYLVTASPDSEFALFEIDLSQSQPLPRQIATRGASLGSGSYGALVAADGFAYFANPGMDLLRIDLNTFEVTSVVARTGVGNPVGLAITGTTAYVAGVKGGLVRIDNLTTRPTTHYFDTGIKNLIGLAVRGVTGYTVDGTGQLWRLDDLTTTPAPTALAAGIGSCTGSSGWNEMALDPTGAYVCMLNPRTGDLYSTRPVPSGSTPPTSSEDLPPVINHRATFPVSGHPCLTVSGTTAYVVDGTFTLYAVDLAPQGTPPPVPTDIDVAPDGHTLTWNPGTGDPYTQSGYTLTIGTGTSLNTYTVHAPATTFDLDTLKIPTTTLTLNLRATRGDVWSPPTTPLTFTRYSNRQTTIATSQDYPQGLAVSPDGKFLYFGTFTYDPCAPLWQVALDGKSPKPKVTLIPQGYSVEGIVVSSNENYVYISSGSSAGPVARIALDSEYSCETITDVVDNPYGLAMSLNEDCLYIANSQGSGDSSKGSVVRVALDGSYPKQNPTVITDTVDNPWGMAISPHGDKLYISNSEGSVVWVALDGSYPKQNPTVVPAVVDNPWGLAMSPNGDRLYIANNNSRNTAYQGSVISFGSIWEKGSSGSYAG